MFRCSSEVQNNRHWSFLTSSAPTMDRTCSANAWRPHTQSSFLENWRLANVPLVHHASATKTTKFSLKAVQIDPSTFEELVTNRGSWRRTIRLGCQRLEEHCIHVTREQRRTRKELEWHHQHSPPPDTAAVFPCDQCGRSCLSKIELFSHTRWHTMQRKQGGRIRHTDDQTDDDDEVSRT